MRIIIDQVPHQSQRYETLGDWYRNSLNKNVLHIKISNLVNWKSELAIMVHELVESVVCLQEGITPEVVDQFDFQFELDQKKGQIPRAAEPGDQPTAPYHKQHQIATEVEKFLLNKLGVTWVEHERYCDAPVEN